MPSHAANFLYRQQRYWLGNMTPKDRRRENALYNATTYHGGRIIVQPVYTDSWRERPDDDPGALIEFTDGSRVVVAIGGHYCMAAHHRGGNPRWSMEPQE